MTNEDILANAPDGATHVDNDVFYRLAKGKHIALGVHADQWESYVNDRWLRCNNAPVRLLSDIRRIVEIEQRLEASERERDGLLTDLLTLVMATGRDDTWRKGLELKEKFAIEQQIKALDEFALVPLSVANHHCEKEVAGYMWLHDALTGKLNRLHQQINGGD